MYITLMEEVPEKLLLGTDLIKLNTYLTATDENDNIIDFVTKYGVKEYKSLFNIIGIEYLSVDSENGLTYKDKNGSMLHISKLPSSKRTMLYA